MTDTPRDLAAKIMAHYGAEHQKDILIEECAELIQAVEKSRRGILAEDKPAYLPRYDCTLILRAAKSVPDGRGGYKIICLLQDRRIKNSFVRARAEDIKQI
jgi:hypothetical protein